MSRTVSRCAFTLVELLVVIAIIGVLVALLLPAVQAAREAARRTQCANNIKQLALACLNYESNLGSLPYGNTYTGNATRVAPSWIALALPYFEQKTLHDRFDFSQFMNHANNDYAMSAPVKTLLCPSDPASRTPLLPGRCTCCSLGGRQLAHGSCYVGNAGPSNTGNCSFCPDTTPSAGNYCCQGQDYGNNNTGPGAFYRWPHGVRLKEITDGTSNTLLLGEALPAQNMHNVAFGINMSVAVTNIPLNNMATTAQLPQAGMSDGTLHSINPHPQMMGFKSLHPGGVMFALADGSVRAIQARIDYRLLNELGTRAGGEPAQVP